jgi:pimeloyl-ACP methyl ester carboxylesterase
MVDVGGGLSLHLHCMGRGEPVVLMEAGLGCDGTTWQSVQPEIARSTRVCVYDRAGAGYSVTPPRPHAIPQMTRELHTLVAKAGITAPFVLVGHSIGGLYARFYAADYPADVAGMVLVDATPDGAPLWALMEKEAVERFDDPRNREGITYDVLRAGLKRFEGQDRSLGARPLVVLTAGNEDYPPEVSAERAAQITRVETELQAALPRLSSNGVQVVAVKSHHFIQEDAPALVIAAAREVVNAVHARGRIDDTRLRALADVGPAVMP